MRAYRSGWLAMTEADRFDFGDSDEWKVEIDPYIAGDGDSFTGAHLKYTHLQPLLRRHLVKASWDVRNASCWNEIDGVGQSATVSFNS